MSSRRAAAAKADKFAALKKAREGGGRNWKPEEDTQLYDEVDEDDYKRIVKGRLQKDDFIEDDGVDGYADNGMDDWGDADQYMSEEEVKPKKVSKKARSSKPKPAPPPPEPVSINDYRPKPSGETEADFMSSLFNDMSSTAQTSSSKFSHSRSRKRKSREASPLPPSSPPHSDDHFTGYRRGAQTDTSSDGPDDFTSDLALQEVSSPMKKPRTSTIGITPAVEKFVKLEMDPVRDEFDDMLDNSFDNDVMMDDIEPVLPPRKIEPTVKKEVPSKVKEVVKKEEDEAPSWLNVHAGLAVVEDSLGPLNPTSSAAVHAADIKALEEDGSLRFFWLDYLEQDGKVHFVGKLKDKVSGAWVSCCVTVENLERNLFVLPRDKRIEDGYETDITPSPADVYKDFDAVRKKVDIKSFKGKFVKRKYAFGEPNVPVGESEWLKIVYPFSEPAIPNGVSSPNFSRIFGCHTSAFELLVMKRKIMGPCWLEIKNPDVQHKGISWCKLEAVVSDCKDINPFAETDNNAPRDLPPLTVMSLSIRTIVNYKDNKREIVCVTSRTWTNIDIEDPTPPDQLPCTVNTLVRPLGKYPPKFETAAKANKKSSISAEANERVLLNRLLVSIYKIDPDVIVGHEFLGVSLDVLLTRMRDLKADNWSRIGRFRRTRWPNIGRQGTNLKFLNGRLLCDLASDGAKSMIASTTWSLTEMCNTHLKLERQDIDPDDIANYFDSAVPSPEKLMTFVRHCELDAHYQMAIAAKVQVLPLTKQLTNLAGNSWNKTLNGGRAERNEYILLHEFHRLKYICPDKTFGKKSAAAVKQEAEDGDVATATQSKGKRDKYKGGLVFEPKRGLWDKYILVMDFNSLYPSIIQEFNIDFTTVDRVDVEDGEEEKIPEPPSSDVPQGVLPRLIAGLVGRRRQVKQLMKDRSTTPAKMLQYDIKQQALKLTANSMYGCLGFEYSRFYARPLAALTTFKGREILTQTRELAESLQLDVVYGDTDSVFVNSNVTDFAQALKISAEFKKQVNDRYKLLEIDLDGVFQRLLLLQKKKYAAIKMEDHSKTSIEVKGLDMKRREYCTLSKNVSQYVLNQILSGEPTEIVVENIHEYLTTMGKSIRAGELPMDEFIIYKRLGKNPEDYPDAKSQPHVTVALRMKKKGGTSHAGDVIPYIFCVGEDTESKQQADKAHHPDELRKAENKLVIDYEYYITQQILPPIERLCDPIEGTDRARLADCLGLDPGRFRSSNNDEYEDQTFGTLESQLPDSVRFKDVDPLILRCRKCEGQMTFSPIHERETSVLRMDGVVCAACEAPVVEASVQAQLEIQIRQHISKYYEMWMVCNDPVCRNRTRSMGVYGTRCLKGGCTGVVAFEYSDAKLYTQLMYYLYLFDGPKALATSKGSDGVKAIITKQESFLHEMTQVVDKYLSQCGRRWVELKTLFSFMKV